MFENYKRKPDSADAVKILESDVVEKTGDHLYLLTRGNESLEFKSDSMPRNGDYIRNKKNYNLLVPGEAFDDVYETEEHIGNRDYK